MFVLEAEKREFVGYLVERFGCDPEFAHYAYAHLSPMFNRDASTRPPEIAPELYADRKDKDEQPIEFLERVYGQWLEGNGLYQFTLSRLDHILKRALDARHGGKRRAELSALLPNKQAEVRKRIGGQLPEDKAERKKVVDGSLRHGPALNG